MWIVPCTRGKSDSLLANVFTFNASQKPASPLSFAKCTQRPPRNKTTTPTSDKRRRSLADVEGEGCTNTCHKKRRLRLTLITSRLSRPYSSPPTHIVNRGLSKIALWAKQKALGRNILRKAAILNRVRLQVEAAREVEQREMELARQAFMQVSLPHTQDRVADLVQSRRQSMIAQTPRRQYIPLPPSPLRLSNYDAFDPDDVAPEEEDFEDEDSEGALIYSDFSIIDPSEPVIDDYDSLDDLDWLPHDHGPSVGMVDERMPHLVKHGEHHKAALTDQEGVS